MESKSNSGDRALDELVTGSYDEVLGCLDWIRELERARADACDAIKNAISTRSGSANLRQFAVQRCREAALTFVETAKASGPLSCVTSGVADRIQLPLNEMVAAVSAVVSSTGELSREAMDRLIGASDIWSTEFKHFWKLLITAGASLKRRRASPVGEPQGISLRDAALAANDHDEVPVNDTMKRWRNSRNPKLPSSIGGNPQHVQGVLYDLDELLTFIENCDGGAVADECRKSLKTCVRIAILRPSKTDCTPSSPSAKSKSKKTRGLREK